MRIYENSKNKREQIESFLKETELRVQENETITHICVEVKRKSEAEDEESYDLFTHAADNSSFGTYVICIVGEYLNDYPYRKNDTLLTREEVTQKILQIIE